MCRIIPGSSIDHTVCHQPPVARRIIPMMTTLRDARCRASTASISSSSPGNPDLDLIIGPGR